MIGLPCSSTARAVARSGPAVPQCRAQRSLPSERAAALASEGARPTRLALRVEARQQRVGAVGTRVEHPGAEVELAGEAAGDDQVSTGSLRNAGDRRLRPAEAARPLLVAVGVEA